MIASLGETSALPTGWKVSRLSDVVDILDSRRVPINKTGRDQRLGDIPYYGATGQVGWIDDYLFDEELVLLGEDGAPFLQSNRPKAYLIRGKSWVNNHAHVLRAKENIDARFLTFALNIADYGPFVSGTTRLKLPQGTMRNIPIVTPPLDEQRQIVAEIETQFARLNDAIAALKRARTRLKRYRASVLKAACEGRLVPTEAELARQEGREYEPASVLLARIKAEREAAPGKGRGKSKTAPALDTSSLPDLPEGWAWTTLLDISGKIGDVDHRMPNAQEAGIPYVSTKDFRNENGIDFENAKLISRNDYDLLSRKIVPTQGDILLSRYGTVGEVRVVETSLPFQASYSVAIIKMTATTITTKFVATCLRSPDCQDHIRSHIRASSQPDVGLASIRALWIPFPPLPEQERICAEVDRVMSVIDQMDATVEANLRRAQSLRQSILQLAFSGRLVSRVAP